MMHWYGGSMVEAVNLSKQRNAIFVVFIEGENDLSVELASTLENQAVVNKLSDETNFLAVKLKSGSENYTHFAKIYQFVPVPSLFFIGRNGTPLEVVCAGVEAHNLAERIDRILDQHYKDKRVQPSTSGQNIREQTESLLQAESTSNPPATEQPPQPEKQAPLKPSEPAKPTPDEAPKVVESAKTAEVVEPESSEPPPKIAKTEHHEVTKSGQEYDVVCDGDVCVRRPKSPTQPGPSQRDDGASASQAATTQATSPSTVSMEEKLVHAKEVIEARRKEKAEKEKQLEKEKEKERRAIGQGVTELKRWQSEQEMKQIQEERKREKLANDLARQRILAQIAQDRVERRARDQPPAATSPAPAPSAAAAAAQLEPPAAAQSEPPAAAAAQPPPHAAATSGDAAGTARIQFKLPDGTAHTAQFDASATLCDMRRYIAENLQMSSSTFSLWTAFPRRRLSHSKTTLLQMQLVPSSAVLVMPRRSRQPVASRSFMTLITQLFTTMILDPTYAIYYWLRERLFPVAPRTPRTPATSPSPPGPAPSSPSSALRRRGNVHRLTGDRGNDDDNNTWNGNSTQQM